MPTLDGSAATTQFLRSDAEDPPVTVIRDMRVRPGSEGRFELLMGALIDAAGRQPGHLGATVVRPHAPDALYRFVYKFDHRSNLAAWHGSEMRARLFESITELVESDRASEYPGLETWFDLPPHFAPPKWKTTLITWAAIYLLVMVMLYAMQAAHLQLPIPVKALVLTAVIVPLVAYLIGPCLGRLLRGWLNAGTRSIS
jgi:antibiotic biosynthesis monooxygenase (ABM) superfamily enzyme